MDQLDDGSFWMVWNPQGRAPTHCHSTEEIAEQEAHRLARLAPGQTFVVLKALYACRITSLPPPPVERVSLALLDQIPF